MLVNRETKHASQLGKPMENLWSIPFIEQYNNLSNQGFQEKICFTMICQDLFSLFYLSVRLVIAKFNYFRKPQVH